MRYSRLFIPTVKEVPAEAEIPSHQLMIRAGLIRKVASGTYTYLPLGWRSLLKIIGIVREEMNAAGAQEILVPSVQPGELWQKTGRDVDYGETLGTFTDRHGRINVLSPTAEEVFTDLVANEISSYKQLPVNLYQISFKFRDEFRPRFGVLRSREFIMKDAYSFDATPEGLDESYQKMYDAYCRIFRRCGLEYVIVEAESGEMGGSGSHQFTIPCENGEDTIVYAEDGSYAANLAKAAVDPLPPPADLAAARQAAGPMEEVHTPDTGTIEGVCSLLGTKPEEMVKTLLFWDTTDAEVRKRMGRYGADHRDGAEDLSARAAVAASGHYRVFAVVIRGDHEVNQEKLNSVAGCPVGLVDDDKAIETMTNAAVGFAGPMGLLDEVDVEALLIDHAVAAMPLGVTGANKTDYHVKNVVPGRDFPLEGPNVVVADIRNAVEGDTHGGRPLRFKRGIEVGQVFKLGTKYSKALGATFLDENDREHPCIMGCYGIGINRILGSAIETGYDKDGCILPVSVAPFEVEVLPLNNDVEAVVTEAARIHDELTAAGVEVLMDDRNVRPGVKFKDADLIGLPLRVVVGGRSLKAGNVEIKRRTDAEPTTVPAAEAVEKVREILEQLKATLA